MEEEKMSNQAQLSISGDSVEKKKSKTGPCRLGIDFNVNWKHFIY